MWTQITGLLLLVSYVWAQGGTDSEPRITWYNPSPLQTCTSVTFAWLYGGPALSASVSITNLGVTQDSPPASSVYESYLTNRAEPTTYSKRAPPATVVELVAQNVPAYRGSCDWAKVVVPQGWYILKATVNNQGFPSAPFFVYNGTDVSCLTTASDPTSSDPAPSSTPPPQTVSPSLTSSATEMPTTSVPPILTQTGAKAVNKGAIAGGVVGGLAVVAAVIAALLFMGVCAFGRKKKQHHADRGESSSSPFATFKWDRKQSLKKSKPAKWGGLGSFDSHSGSPYIDAPEAAQPKSRSHTFGAVAATTPAAGRQLSQSEESLAEKYRNVQQYEQDPSQQKRGSNQTSATSHTDATYDFDYEYAHEVRHAAYPPTSPTTAVAAVVAADRPRAPSRSSSFASTILTQANPFSPSSSSPSLATAGGVASEAMEHSISTSSTTAANRSSNGAPAARKTPRKPAPVYEASVVDDPLDTPTSTFSPTSTSTSMASPIPPHVTSQNQSKRKSSSGKSHYEPRHASGQPELRHQNSFGDGRPVHFLIPDMPLQQN